MKKENIELEMTRIVGLHRHKRRWCSRCPELPPPAPKPPGWSHLQTSWESEQDLWSSHGMIRGFWFFSMLDFLAPCLRECVLFSFTALLNSTWGRSFQTVNRVFSISSWRVGWLLAAVMQLVVKLAKACSSCESQLSTELLQDESGRQAVANLKDFLSVLVGQWASPFNCVNEIEDCQHYCGCVLS